jgi:hypothetical protein
MIAVLLGGFIISSSARGQANSDKPPQLVTMIELLGNPARYDGKLITVRGFLEMWKPPRDVASSILYLHEEDATFLLNGIAVVPTSEMLERFDSRNRRYVSLTGEVAVTATGSEGTIVGIRNIQECEPWPPPYLENEPPELRVR